MGQGQGKEGKPSSKTRMKTTRLKSHDDSNNDAASAKGRINWPILFQTSGHPRVTDEDKSFADNAMPELE